MTEGEETIILGHLSVALTAIGAATAVVWKNAYVDEKGESIMPQQGQIAKDLNTLWNQVDDVKDLIKDGVYDDV